MGEARNILNWMAHDYLGSDPFCTIDEAGHLCYRRDGRLVRSGMDSCHESAARQVLQESRCVKCGHGPRPLWNSVLVPYPGGGMAHAGCLDDDQYDRYVEMGS